MRLSKRPFFYLIHLLDLTNMAYAAKVLADSLCPKGIRLTTFSVTYPRFVHAELMTHRVFSRNSASSRAIPVHKMLKAIEDDPVFPVWWGKNQSGMQAKEELPAYNWENQEEVEWDLSKDWACQEWLSARRNAINSAAALYADGEGLHKQICNRITEPWMWITVIVSATEFDNWWNLRVHPDAQPEIRHIAEMMADLYFKGEPKELKEGEWHLPLWGFEGDEEDHTMDDLFPIDFPSFSGNHPQRVYLPEPVLISAGRVARVSYLTHEGKRDPEADIELAVDRLLHPKNPQDPGHWSPWEHPATPFTDKRWGAIGAMQQMLNPFYDYLEDREVNEMKRNLEFSGNFRGWTQARKHFTHESGTVWEPVSIR